MEWCNQSTAIKYLFKYIHKGFDKNTASFVNAPRQPSRRYNNIDEIHQYLYYRYVSPCEAAWRLFGYKIHGRKPAVERMFFHLIGEKLLFYSDYDRMENVLEKASVTKSMFSSWLIANETYDHARELTYDQFVTMFVYHKRQRMWMPRKKGVYNWRVNLGASIYRRTILSTDDANGRERTYDI
ncbi:uncharacterized protein LOC131660825 [Vicia villosa]|uniref:uncharacterized protein LOC131660825 n=1 Tax=Vicia villosa TaxID=3911 RepID=UPI00273C3435|nr:uncharacterized protein LOC131660825 [Vicia villosa]